MVRDCGPATDYLVPAPQVRVLLVEDSLAEARLMQEFLQHTSLGFFQLIHVNRLSAAIAQLNAVVDEGALPFDVILLDLTLPDSSGLVSLDTLIQHSPSLPIVVLTNTNDEELAVASVRRGAQDYLVKRNVNQEILVRSIRYAIERKQAAEALREANETLELRVQSRTAELEAANASLKQEIKEKKQLEAQFLRAQRLESLGTLASGIAHDLNNVLTPVLGVAQLLPLRIPNLDDGTQRLLMTLEASARRGSDLIKQILSFARGVEGTRIDLQANHILAEIAQIIRQTLPKSITIEMEAPPDLWILRGDATQLHQVIMNLCINARDAMPKGGTLSLTARNLVLNEFYTQLHLDAKVGPYVVITVTDTGTGIPAEILSHIFDPFFTTKAVGHGTGLGLSAVLGIVKSHGGFVDVQSEMEQGSQFSLYLPATPSSVPRSPETSDLIRGQQELILVVDDEIPICNVIKTTLETYNYRVLTVSDGLEAIARYTKYKDEIHAVLIDMMMPGLDGLKTFSLLHRFNPNIYGVAMSGLNSTEAVAQARDLGFQHFLAKPFTARDLLLTLPSELSPSGWKDPEIAQLLT